MTVQHRLRGYLAAALALAAVAEGHAAVTVVEPVPGPSYRLSGSLVASRAALASGRARLVFEQADNGDGFYLLLQAEQASFHEVRGGRDRPIGVSGPLWRDAGGDRLAFSLQRTEWQMLFVCNKVVAARAEADSRGAGDIGHEVEGRDLKLESFAVQPTEEVYFSDDFMRTGDEFGGWQPVTGRWENNQQGSKASRSANAFSFRALGQTPCLAVVGYPFWSSYVAQAAVRDDGTGAVGLVVAYQGEGDYLRLRWTSEHNPDGGTCRLQRVFGGTVTDLTPPVPGGFRPGAWYKVQLGLAGGRAYGWIDEVPVFEAAVQVFGEGQVGLYRELGEGAKDDEGALFDDVVVRSWPVFDDDFSAASSGRWDMLGEWKLGSGPDGAAQAPAEGLLLAKPTTWGQATCEADVRYASGTVGLAACIDNGGSGYLLTCAPDHCELVRLDQQQATVLDEQPVGLTEGTWHRVSLSLDAGLIRARLDDQHVLEAFDLSHPQGRWGLLARDSAEATFDRVRVRFRPTFWSLPPSLPADFVVDQYMTAWAAPGAAWVEVAGSPVRWHKGLFFGDRRVRFTIPAFGRQTGKVTVLLGAQEAGSEQGALALTFDLPGGKALTVTARRGDQVLGTASPTVEGDDPELVCELRGRFVLVWLDGVNVLHQRIGEE